MPNPCRQASKHASFDHWRVVVVDALNIQRAGAASGSPKL